MSNLPAPYFKVNMSQPDALEGRNLLSPIAMTSDMIRPRIGGRRTRKQKRRQQRKQKKGGFLPSVGEGFSAVAAKYITPIALYSLYRFMDNSSSTHRRRSRARASRKR
jgi:hypothetical protein